MTRHSCNISSKEAELLGRNYAEIGPANLHASTYYSEYNERSDYTHALATTYLAERFLTTS